MSDHATYTYDPDNPETWIEDPPGTDQARTRLRDKKRKNSNGLDSGLDNSAEKQKPGRILTGTEFMASFVPPDWLVDGIVQRGRLYACTSLTGHGKTAVWSFIACMVHAGRMVGNLEISGGHVLFLAGENPEDLKARLHGMAAYFNLKPGQMPFVLPGNFPLNEQEAAALMRDIAALGIPISLIVGDTASSFFPGDDENDNVQAGTYARTLRRFTRKSMATRPWWRSAIR